MRRVLRIEEAQDVALQAVSLDGGQRGRVGAVVGRELLDVGGPAGRIADRVQPELQVRQPDVAVEAEGELDQLGVDRRPRVADRLDVELPELPVAPGLGPVVAEHRAGHRELHRLRQRLHPVLDVRPDDARGRLGAEGPGLRFLVARGQPEELLLDDVGHLADAALEDGGLLEERRLDLPIAVARARGPSRPSRAGGTRLVRRAAGRASRGELGRPSPAEV